MMLFEYLEQRNGRAVGVAGAKHSMTREEANIIGIPFQKKGWLSTNIEIPDNKMAKVLRAVRKNDKISDVIKNRLRSLVLKKDSRDTQLVYVFRNEAGLYKIGISQHPVKRARDLSNASGMLVTVIACWSVFEASQAEAGIHKLYKKERTLGEWFKFIQCPVANIDEHLTKHYSGTAVEILI